MNASESMLTYAKEMIGSLLGDRRWSWTIMITWQNGLLLNDLVLRE
ncbi:hypothetical protein [Acinetobacter baumannii]